MLVRTAWHVLQTVYLLERRLLYAYLEDVPPASLTLLTDSVATAMIHDEDITLSVLLDPRAPPLLCINMTKCICQKKVTLFAIKFLLDRLFTTFSSVSPLSILFNMEHIPFSPFSSLPLHSACSPLTCFSPSAISLPFRILHFIQVCMIA
jgi:hypothetical protein